MRISLASPPNWTRNSYMVSSPNLGLLYLGGAIKARLPGHVVQYVDARLSFEEHIAKVAAFDPDVYAISFASPLAAGAVRMMRAVNHLLPNALIICGGPHPTFDPFSVLKQAPAQVCCIGEGEDTIVELIEAYQNGGSYDSIDGIAFRDSSGRIRKTRERPPSSDLDRIAPPDWDSVDFGLYSNWRQSRGNVPGIMSAARGCPFHCVFCSSPVWRGTPLRKRSPAAIAEEVHALYRRGVRELYIRSDEMNVDLGWSVAVFDAIAALNHKDLYIQCNLRAHPITGKLAVALRRANCWLCNIGIESGSQRVLDGIKKGITLTETERGLCVLREHRIKAFGFFMLYQAWERNGILEFETTPEVFKTLVYALMLRSRNLITGFSWAFATPYPGSELYEIASKHRLFVESPSDFANGSQIALRLPGVPSWQMAAAFACGVGLQAVLAVVNPYRMAHFRANLVHAVRRTASMIASLRHARNTGLSG